MWRTLRHSVMKLFTVLLKSCRVSFGDRTALLAGGIQKLFISLVPPIFGPIGLKFRVLMWLPCLDALVS